MSEHLAEPTGEQHADVTGDLTGDLTGDVTGDASVDAVVASLRDLDELPVEEHVAVFERAHETLRSVLSAAGEPAPAPGG